MAAVADLAAAEAAQASSGGGFYGWISDVGDNLWDIGGDVAKIWAQNEFAEDKQVDKAPAAAGSDTANAPVVAAGVPTPVSSFDLFGLKVPKTAAYVGGAAILTVVLVKAL